MNNTAPASHNSLTAFAHRPDIDGLRALAVLPVVAYHAGIRAVGGGFVGVDIFFVISGYLISSLLIREIAAGQFSILRFYERRIRRIFPALFAALIGTAVMAWNYNLPSELIDISKSAIAAVMSVSNFYFWQQAGYFDGSALSKPLLHTWSLAVEEQFYIVWPLILLLVYRYARRHALAATLWLTGISLVFSSIAAYTAKDAAYYLVPSRAWELLLGAIVAYGALPVPRSAIGRELYTASALLMIVASVFLINGDMPFPGLVAIPPTLGAAMIIAAGQQWPLTVTGRLLTWKPVTFIGLISYSLYLWHWPISVYEFNNGMLLGEGADRTRKIAIIVVSIIAATLSWKFIEQPFRTGRFKPAPRPLAWFAAITSSLIVAVSALAWAREGFPTRFPPEAIRMASWLDFKPATMFRDGTCFLRAKVGEPKVADECVQLAADRKNLLILGDSHAAQLWWGLKETRTDVNVMQLTGVGCLPVLITKSGESSRCRELFDNAFKWLETERRIDTVVIAGRWTENSLPAVENLIEWSATHQVKVLLIGPSVIYRAPLPRLLAESVQRENPSLPDQRWDLSLADLDKRMAELARSRNTPYFSLIDAMCMQQQCTTLTPTGNPVVFDQEHFTDEGSVLVAQQLAPQL